MVKFYYYLPYCSLLIYSPFQRAPTPLFIRPISLPTPADDLSFTQKKEYGKVPAYIAKRKEEEAIEHAQYEEYLRTVQMQDAPYQVCV